MSDFEQWAENDDYVMNFSLERDEDGRYFDTHVENMLRGWNAAIASMQGEAVAYRHVESDTPISIGQFEALKAEHAKDSKATETLNNLQPLFTYQPDAAAEIARLTKELEEARKDAESLRQQAKDFDSLLRAIDTGTHEEWIKKWIIQNH
jgi:hypothetical protein